jgi:hypothetical protein
MGHFGMGYFGNRVILTIGHFDLLTITICPSLYNNIQNVNII